MGIFRILGRLLDDFAFNGKYPMNTADSNNELTWIIMETMVRQTKTGLSSTVRDRNSAYRRGLGWEIEEGRESDRIRKPTLRLATYSTSLSKMHSFTITINDWQLQFRNCRHLETLYCNWRFNWRYSNVAETIPRTILLRSQLL